ncbi:hypothetical protein [Ekhidna sp.]|uniref:hypothetical protein n=1 Tax=Ekhidna sp. TaxID=2608089 RepID=UPI0032EE4683
MKFNFKTFKVFVSFWVTISILILCLIVSCDPDSDDIINAKYLIAGSVKYLDVASGEIKQDDSSVISISYITNPTVVDGLAREKSGSKWQFGPLKNGTYELAFKLTKEYTNSEGEMYMVDYVHPGISVVINESSQVIPDTIVLRSVELTRYFVRGNAQFEDPLTGDLETDANINIALSGNGANLSKTGGSFELGPLKPGDYKLQFELVKENVYETGNTLRFKYESNVIISNADVDLGNITLNRVTGATKFVQGTVDYVDLLTGTSGGSFSDVRLTITPVNASNIQIGASKILDVNSNFFIGGPVNSGRYRIQISNMTTDNEFNQSLYYDYSDYHNIQPETDTLILNLSLEWRSNTALLLQITDKLNNPIPAGVCYYSNLDFLNSNLPSCDGAIADSVTTTSGGRMLLQNLDELKYYFNVSSKIGSVLLSNHDEIDGTSSEILSTNQLNTHTIIIDKN